MNRTAGEYRIITTGAGFLTRTDRGRLRFVGRDSASFLQALLTNEVAALQPGTGTYSAYLTPQGRMLADLNVYQTGTHILADVPASRAAWLAERFDQLIFTEDVRVSDVSASVEQVSVVGVAAEEVVARLAGLGDELFAARTHDTELPSLDVFVPTARVGELLDRLRAAGAEPIGMDFFNALRIDAGRPAFGVDMTEETIPLEAGLLDRAISTTKGCYVGQEVIVRVLHRGGGRVAKRLVRLAFDVSLVEPPAAGTELLGEQGSVGRLTSAAFSPKSGRVVALGYVHRDSAEIGRHVTAGGVDAEITGFAR